MLGAGLQRRRRLGVLVGPGVVRDGCVDGLHAFAARHTCGVVNTWGAKGVFRWDDPRHHGTAGLQARDFELAGLAAVDVLVTSGLDPAEVTSHPWTGRAEVMDVPPHALAAVVLDDVEGTLERPALYTRLAAVVGPLYERAGSAAARAAAIAAALEPGGLVVAEPGLAGFWIARTFPTERPGTVLVPASGGAPAAHQAAIDAVSAGRQVRLIAHARVALPGVEVEVWTPDVVDLDPSALLAVAGKIVAWPV